GGGFRRLDETRTKRRAGRPGRLGGTAAAAGRVGEQGGAGRQRDLALAGLSFHELPRDDLLDRARRALGFDSGFFLEQADAFLARRAQQFGDLVSTDSGQFGASPVDVLRRSLQLRGPTGRVQAPMRSPFRSLTRVRRTTLERTSCS